MAPMLSADPGRPAALRDVLQGCLDAMLGRRSTLGLPPLRNAAVLLIDGLGADALAARRGHARTLGGALTKRSVIASGYPTTTASALSSLTTGADPGRHGVVGYTALDPATGAVVNQLRGFDHDLPPGWLRSDTVFDRATAAGVRAVAIGPRHYALSGFTASVLHGAEYIGARTIEQRLEAMLEVFAGPDPALAYVYVPELDTAAHGHGWQSVEWTAELEAVDAAVGAALPALDTRDGLLVTADHGMVDVRADDHRILEDDPALLQRVRAIAGEPRCLQLHLHEGGDPSVVAATWAGRFGADATVVTRSEAVSSGWFGVVDEAVLPRIGDVLVAARGAVAFYETADARGRGMVGQHGAWSKAERIVPLLRFGAARR